MPTIRTRFAPSPTGYIHVGNVRSALFPWLLARQNNGRFVVRIEDTDQARFVIGATDLIFETLKWLGLDWDEGPDIGGPFSPYVQSQRKDIYLKWANRLIEKGLAYADPYSPEEVEAFRQESVANKKPFLFRNHRPSDPPKWDGSQPLRFKVPELKRYSWHDPVMGDLSAGAEALDDFILIKSDGLPTYNFAHIVDDSEMEITHVIRGMEYISSIPKYLSLYEALGIEPPVLVCLPHIMAPDGKKKLGKRDGAKSVTDYRDQGILPEAMLNFLASLGWNDGTEQEIFSLAELVEKFKLERVQKAGARFDEKRLIWMNGYYIRNLSLDKLYDYSQPFWPATAKQAGRDYKLEVLKLVQERLKYLAELPELTGFLFTEPEPDLNLIYSNKNLQSFDKTELANLLRQAADLLNESDFSIDDLTNRLNSLLEITSQKPGVLFGLIRLATTWSPASPALAESLHVLGKEKSLKRINQAIEILSA